MDKINLTESQLHRVIKDSVNKILVEFGYRGVASTYGANHNDNDEIDRNINVNYKITKYMKNKVIRLTEEELHNLVKQIIDKSLNEIDGKTHARVSNATTMATNQLQNGISQKNITSKVSGNKHVIDYNDIIDNAAGTEQRAKQSLLRPFINEQIMFYAVNRLGRTVRLIFQVEDIKKLMDNIAILSGNVIYDGCQMNGDLMIDFTQNKIFYTERKSRYKYTLVPNNYTIKVWNELTKQLKMSLDNRI
jgi:hypothetical protein